MSHLSFSFEFYSACTLLDLVIVIEAIGLVDIILPPRGIRLGQLVKRHYLTYRGQFVWQDKSDDCVALCFCTDARCGLVCTAGNVDLLVVACSSTSFNNTPHV